MRRTLFLATWMNTAGGNVTPENYPRLLTESFGGNATVVGEPYPLERFDGSAPTCVVRAAITDAGIRLRDRPDVRRTWPTTKPVYAYELYVRLTRRGYAQCRYRLQAAAGSRLRQLAVPPRCPAFTRAEKASSESSTGRCIVAGVEASEPKRGADCTQYEANWKPHFVANGSPERPLPAGTGRPRRAERHPGN